MESSERYLPNGWTRTVEEIAQNEDRVSWPTIEDINDNLFQLAIDIETHIDDLPSKSKEELILSFAYGNNEIILVQQKSCFSREPGKLDYKVLDERDKGQQYSYSLEIIDHNTNSIMYFEPKLQRVEIAKPRIEAEKPLFNEDLEVIAQIDDDEDNPFETQFEDAES